MKNTAYKILLVDDHALTLDVLKHSFSLKDFDVEIANSGAEALEHLKNNFFHAVITDINMPEMCGITLAQIISSQNDLTPFNKRTVIVGITATPHHHYSSAISAGIEKIFTKPTEFPEIEAYLKETFVEIGH